MQDVNFIHIFVLLCNTTLIFSQHPAICFHQELKLFKLAEPVSYSEFFALMLNPSEPMFPIRCLCPMSSDNRILKLQSKTGSIADPKICSNRVRADVDYTILSPNEVLTFYIGFKIWEPAFKIPHFVAVVEMVFNKRLRTPVYAKYKYRSPNLNYFVFWASRNYEPTQEYDKETLMHPDQNLDEFYSPESQNEIFSQFYDDPYYKDIFEDEKPPLVKQQLAQQNDFLLETWKEVTYFDVNTAPIFRKVQWTWMKIETFVISVAKALHRHLYITTGVSMIKKFIDWKRMEIEIYLDSKTSTPVPDIFWKALQYTNVHDDEENKFGLLVIMHNDPLYYEAEPLCSKISAGKQWDELFETVDDQDSKNIAYTCALNRENLQNLRLPVSIPVVDNFLNVEELQKRFGTDDKKKDPVFRFV